jgi:hypothetical protein
MGNSYNGIYNKARNGRIADMPKALYSLLADGKFLSQSLTDRLQQQHGLTKGSPYFV